MNRRAEILEEDLHALVDGELSVDDKARLLDLSREDEAVNGELCRLRQLKAMVQNAYEAPPLPERNDGGSGPKGGRWLAQAVVALLLVAISGLGGWYAHGLRHPTLLADAGRAPLLVQLDTNDPRRAMAALSKARRYVAARSGGAPMKVEIVAYGKGLDLMRRNGSPEAQAVIAMARELGDVSLFACRQAIREAESKGVKVRLYPGVGTVPRALDEIVTKLTAGWHDIRA